MPKGGTLTIATGNRHLDSDYVKLNSVAAPGDYVMIAVSDTGTGMTPDVVAMVFEPFFTTKEQGKGTGLGLSMVFGFAKQSGGHVSIYSEPGLGTTVRLFLPRAPRTAEAHVETRPLNKATPVKGRGETVLVVEDNGRMRHAVVRQLTLLNYRALEVDSVAAAMEVLEAEEIDLVFSDVVMPGGMDGFDLAERIRTVWPSVRILLTSGFSGGQRSVRPNGPKSPSRFLGKPYDLIEMARAVRETLDGGILDTMPKERVAHPGLTSMSNKGPTTS
jgi:CheY-like chemotaxis protein